MTYRMNTGDRPACPHVASTGERHFAGICEDCDAWLASRQNLGTIEDWYRDGRLTADAFEAYSYVWAKHSPSRDPSRPLPLLQIPTVRRMAAKIEHYKGLS